MNPVNPSLGEFQASQKLADAAEVMGKQPMALQLRFLQSLVEVSSEKNSTIIVPIPIDLLTPFLKKTETSEGQLLIKFSQTTGVTQLLSCIAPVKIQNDFPLKTEPQLGMTLCSHRSSFNCVRAKDPSRW